MFATTDQEQLTVRPDLGKVKICYSHEGGGHFYVDPRQGFSRAALLGAAAFNALEDDRDEDLRFFLIAGIVTTFEPAEAFAFAQELQRAALESLVPSVFVPERIDGAHAACAAPRIQ